MVSCKYFFHFRVGHLKIHLNASCVLDGFQKHNIFSCLFEIGMSYTKDITRMYGTFHKIC